MLNYHFQEDTICAPATAVGGALAVIRISGADAFQIAEKHWQGSNLLSENPDRKFFLGSITDSTGKTIDAQCLAVKMSAPNSFTGENCVEFHCHGGAYSVSLILAALSDSACRIAEPGEFSRRAFLNAKLDLTQAEAVADLINAASESALKLANEQLQGSFGRQIGELYDNLFIQLCEIEARIDFPEEGLEWQSIEEVQEKLQEMLLQIEALAESRKQGKILREGLALVIAGIPNVGKSSLLNAILGRERAIVSDIPGTTRDSIEEAVSIRGIKLRLIDTAGIRQSEDQIEKIGVSISKKHLQEADLILWTMDATKDIQEQLNIFKKENISEEKTLFVLNKADLLSEKTIAEIKASNKQKLLYTCALNGDGLKEVLDDIEKFVWKSSAGKENAFAVSARHGMHLINSAEALRESIKMLQIEDWELSAENLKYSTREIGKINGKTSTDDILGEIFSKFCIGK